VIWLLKRVWHCLQALKFDSIIVRRELLLFNDYGGLFMERFLMALNGHVALDFDDDIETAKCEPRPVRLFGKLMLESGSKFRDSLKLYPRVIAGSSYLSSMVQSVDGTLVSRDIVVVPTCVDPAEYPRKDYGASREDDRLSFGWIGSVGNLRYLDLVLPALEMVSRNHPLKLVVISGRPFERDTSFEIMNIPWTYETQGESLQAVDVGLMPLHDGAEERGKCAFKLLQYMACGIVSVGSAVTTNIEVIEDGVNGFLVRRETDWSQVLREVLRQRERFAEIGEKAVKTVRSRYSFDAHRVVYGDFLERLSAQEGRRLARGVRAGSIER
jgi:glycosyltransferase involved in cell wall biosynthesis